MSDAPTVDDAINALTDPDLRGMGPAQNGFVPMHAFKVLGRLQADGTSQEDAHALVREGLAQLGGEDRSHWLQSKGLGRGLMPRHQWVPDYWVPASMLRKDE